jgi:signal transduction histidine kinase
MIKSRLFLRLFSQTVIQILIFFALLYAALSPVITKTVFQRDEHYAQSLLEYAYNLANDIYLTYKKESQDALVAKRFHIKNNVSTADFIIRAWQEDVKEGRVTDPEARKNTLRRLRMYQHRMVDYLWICDYDGKIVFHPDPQIEGKDFSRVKDARGNLFVPDLIRQTREEGEAYITYWWRRPGEVRPVEKLLYSRLVPGWKWVLVSSARIEDLTQEIEIKKHEAIQSFGTLLNKTTIGETGYLLVFNSSGILLVHPNRAWQGRNLGKLADPLTGKPVLQELAESSKRPDHLLHYKWDRPQDPGHYVYEKLAWTRYFEGLDWYISATVYVEDLKASALELQKRMLFIASIFLITAILVAYFFTRSIVNPIMSLSAMTREVRSGNLDLTSHSARDDEIGELSKDFDAMVVQLKHRKEALELANRDLKAANEELKELDTLKSSFLSMVSHELRTPLTSVLGFAKVIIKKLEQVIFPILPKGDRKVEKTARQVKDDLEIIVSEGERLTGIINDVLDLAKMEAGKIEWKMEPVDIVDVVEKAAAATSSLFTEKNLRLFREIEEGLPPVRGDRDRLIQVVINLLSNALKFTRKGLITVRARKLKEAEAGIPGIPVSALFARDPTGNFIKVSVSDTGIGIAREYLEDIFEEFKQIGDTITDKPQGTGLGLPICRQIIENHGGIIWAESELRKGSTFSFILPVERESEMGEMGDRLFR